MICGKSLLIFFYSIAITSFGCFLKLSLFFSDFLHSFYPSDTNVLPIYDYIIVGSGSAGSIIANRLANDVKTKVLVVEAGRHDSSLLHIPILSLLLHKTPYDWNYETVSQKTCCLALNKNVSIWPMGKILGGTSMLNNMLYVRGHRKDYEEWFKDKRDYNYQDILAYFERSENSQFSDQNKLIYLSDLMYTSSLPEIFLKAATALGYPLHECIESRIGFCKPKANLYHGKRWTSTEKLKLNSNPNLHIKTNRLVEKVLLRSNFEAYGVEYRYFGRKYRALAKKAVVLSAGVIGTPKILMLSGIGRKDHLEKIGIKTLIDLPVGDNLQDHLTTGFGLILLNQTLELGLKNMLSPSSILEYFFRGVGPWTTTGCEVIAYFNTKNSSLTDYENPDLQFMVMPMGITEDDGLYLRKLVGISDKVWSDYFSKIEQPTMTVLPILLHPKSKGSVRLASANPLAKPIIDPKYLTFQEDIDVLVNGIRIIKTFIESEEMTSFGAKFNTDPFPACSKHVFDSKDYWECYIRYFSITAYHPVGTCKMGSHTDATTVVDFNFQVKGTNKLYVVDASVFPSLTSGNINAAIFMLAEMASDVVKRTDFFNSRKSELLDIFIPKIVC